MKFTEAYEHLQAGKTLELSGVTIRLDQTDDTVYWFRSVGEPSRRSLEYVRSCFHCGHWGNSNVLVIDNRVLPKLPSGCEWVLPGTGDYSCLYVQAPGAQHYAIDDEDDALRVVGRINKLNHEVAIHEARLKEYRTRPCK